MRRLPALPRGATRLAACALAGLVLAGLAGRASAQETPPVVPAAAPGDTPCADGTPGPCRKECRPACTASEVCDDGTCRPRFSAGRPGTGRGLLEVRSEPPRARVTLDGQKEGQTPLTRPLSAGTHRLTVELEGYDRVDDRVRVEPGQAVERTFTLEATRAYPASPYKKAGHGCFWGGLALLALGGIGTYEAHVQADRMRDGDWDADPARKAWKGVSITSYTLGSAAVLAGILLWTVSPSDKAWWRSHQAVIDVGPARDGAIVSIDGRW